MSALLAAGPATAFSLRKAYDATLLSSDTPTSAAAVAQGHEVGWVVIVCVAAAARAAGRPAPRRRPPRPHPAARARAPPGSRRRVGGADRRGRDRRGRVRRAGRGEGPVSSSSSRSPARTATSRASGSSTRRTPDASRSGEPRSTASRRTGCWGPVPAPTGSSGSSTARPTASAPTPTGSTRRCSASSGSSGWRCCSWRWSRSSSASPLSGAGPIAVSTPRSSPPPWSRRRTGRSTGTGRCPPPSCGCSPWGAWPSRARVDSLPLPRPRAARGIALAAIGLVALGVAGLSGAVLASQSPSRCERGRLPRRRLPDVDGRGEIRHAGLAVAFRASRGDRRLPRPGRAERRGGHRAPAAHWIGTHATGACTTPSPRCSRRSTATRGRNCARHDA